MKRVTWFHYILAFITAYAAYVYLFARVEDPLRTVASAGVGIVLAVCFIRK